MLNNKRIRIWFFAGMGALAASGSVCAQTLNGADNGVEAQLLLCADRTTDAARLACYDGLAESLRTVSPIDQAAEMPPAPAPASQPAPVAPPPAVDPTTGVPATAQSSPPATRNTESFDTEVKQKQSIRVMIEKTKRNARGDWYFYFDNEEVWKQIDSRSRRIPPLPVAATVSRGLFSSHKLHIDGEVWAMKIRRVK